MSAVYVCEYAKRPLGKDAVVCLKDEKPAICAHQYFCPATRKWENTPEAKVCEKKKQK